MRKPTKFRSEQTKKKRLANLAKGTKFPPGKSGNPGGRPHKLPISDRMAEAIEHYVPDKAPLTFSLAPGSTWADLLKQMELPVKTKWADAMVRAEIQRAFKDSKAFHALREALEGTSPHRIIVSADPEKPKIAPCFVVQFIQIDPEHAGRAAKIIDVGPDGKPRELTDGNGNGHPASTAT